MQVEQEDEESQEQKNLFILQVHTVAEQIPDTCVCKTFLLFLFPVEMQHKA